MPDRRRYARTPDTILILSGCAVSGIAILVAAAPPGSILSVAPFWAGMLWAACLAVSSIVALVGVYWRDELIGWALELSGRLTLAMTTLLYSVILGMNVSNPGSWFIVTLAAAVGIASGWRVWQLTRRLNQWASTVLRVTRAAKGAAR